MIEKVKSINKCYYSLFRKLIGYLVWGVEVLIFIKYVLKCLI